jgi:two-component system nitrogen regulation sensor histidine kinase NtrY
LAKLLAAKSKLCLRICEKMLKLLSQSSNNLIFQSLLAWLRRNLLILLILAVGVSLAISYIIVDSSPSSLVGSLSMKPKKMMTLLSVNVALITLIISIIATRIYRLWATIRVGAGGSRLQRRIVVMFSIVTITPAIVVSIFSALFFNIGIQSWFNERVQRVVAESMAVAEAYLAEHKDNIRADAIAMAGDLGRDASISATPQEFARNVETQSILRLLTEAVVIQHGRIVAQGKLSFALAFEALPQDVFDRADKGEVIILPTENDKVRALTKIPNLDEAYLLVGRLVDSKVIAHMNNADGAVNEYEKLKDQLNRLQLTFSTVFVSLALLLLISSVWYGMVFASRLTRPIRSLVRAAERVRGGDFSARIEKATSKDEFGTLSRTFNRMTEQLEAQRGSLIEANRRLDERRRFTETVLSGVSAGVIALNNDKRVTLYNRSSIAILGRVDKQIIEGEYIDNSLPDIRELLVRAEQFPKDIVESTITINNADNGEKSITLHVRVTVEMLEAEIEGFIVTFDDITQLVSAQRNVAWADVARRVAHEIKNPLTPIQLSAERIKRKYLPVIAEEAEVFNRYVDTITKHVGDIGKMVDEFVSFARNPSNKAQDGKFQDEDISELVRKAVFSAQVANPTHEFSLTLPEIPAHLNCDERQITQVLTNILKNASEAIAECGDRAEKGKVGVAVSATNEKLEIIVEDNGIGILDGDASKIFEPYITTRKTGTGLGLSIVKKIVEDHNGLIKIENGANGGAKVTVSFLLEV